MCFNFDQNVGVGGGGLGFTLVEVMNFLCDDLLILYI